jgi:hypothetical protein
MSNEELIEEILYDAFKLNIYENVMNRAKEFENRMSLVDSFQLAFYEEIKNIEVIS